MTSFYGALAEPLKIVSVQLLGGTKADARYRYPKSSGAVQRPFDRDPHVIGGRRLHLEHSACERLLIIS
jgi:hypothetical protein